MIIVALSRISMRLVNDVLEAQGGESALYGAAAAPQPGRLRHRRLQRRGFLLPGHAVAGWLALAAAAAIANLLNDWRRPRPAPALGA